MVIEKITFPGGFNQCGWNCSMFAQY